MQKPRLFSSILQCLTKKNNRKLISVVPLYGIIGQAKRAGKAGMDIDSIDPCLEKAFKQKSLKAVALLINSPGGSPVQSMLIAERIRYWAEEKKTPVYAFTLDAAASGGYWLACAGDEIYAAPSSIIGSIGVVSAGFGFPELLAKLGIERRLYTAGKSKAMLDPFSDERKEDVKHLHDLQQDIHEQFCDWVRIRRAGKLKNADETMLFSGKFWTGRKACDLGLVDAEGTLHSVLRKKFGKKIRFKHFAPKRGFSLSFLSGITFFTALDDFLSERYLWQRLGRG